MHFYDFFRIGSMIDNWMRVKLILMLKLSTMMFLTIQT